MQPTKQYSHLDLMPTPCCNCLHGRRENALVQLLTLIFLPQREMTGIPSFQFFLGAQHSAYRATNRLSRMPSTERAVRHPEDNRQVLDRECFALLTPMSEWHRFPGWRGRQGSVGIAPHGAGGVLKKSAVALLRDGEMNRAVKSWQQGTTYSTRC